MTTHAHPRISPDHTLAELATELAGASRVFQRHELDFCCGGGKTLGEACRERRLAVIQVIGELEQEVAGSAPARDWRDGTISQLLTHIVDGYHRSHREELPRLWAMADKVERVHAGKSGLPRGLAAHLRWMVDSLDLHMQKEEQVLFPWLLVGEYQRAMMPISCMEHEHEEHGRSLAKTRDLTNGLVPPAEACTTWRALYAGLEEFERAVMEHVHLENHVLFPWVRELAG